MNREVINTEVRLELIAIEEKSVLRNLLELCQHDSSEFNGAEIDQHGCFGYQYLDHYWTEAGRYPFFILTAGKVAGFALIRTLAEEGNDAPLYSLAEFFILRKYRRQGIGGRAARQIFDQFAGTWKVGQEANNTVAQHFWRTVIAAYSGGKYREYPREEGGGVFQTFRS